MKKAPLFLILTAAFCMAICLPACKMQCKQGSGKQITQARTVAPFTKLDISGGYKVLITQGATPSLSIMADDNLMPDIKADVSGDKLTIHSTSNFCSIGQFVINVTMPDVTSIKTSGAVDLQSTAKLTLKDLDLNLAGASKVTFNLDAANLTTEGSGMTEVNLTGQASSHTINASGTCKINALDFIVAKYSIQTSGISHCQVNVLNKLDVNSSGASDIEYRGNPSDVKNDKSGASTLKKID